MLIVLFSEFPPDQQEGWNGKSQYPRISYVFNKQVDTKRSSSGQLTVALYDIMDPLEVEKIEVAIRNCLQDVVMKPEGEAPMCFAWARSEPYILEGNAVLCKEIAFDILEYPAQETTDPDPVMALNRYIKNLFPECIVFGIDELSEYTIPADTPVFYSGLKSIDSTDGHCRSSLSWFNAVISVHLLCPKPSLRLKMMAALHQSLAKDEEIIMFDDSPMVVKALKMNNNADYLREGQMSLTGYYACLKDTFKQPGISGVTINDLT